MTSSNKHLDPGTIYNNRKTPEMIKIDPLYEHDIPWECRRSPKTNLVYFVHRKCASMFYIEVLESLGWTYMTMPDINWQKDFVFSHIRDPLVKHRKGIVEGLTFRYPELFKKIYKDDLFLPLLANVTSVDSHSFTLYRQIGTKALDIHWIPLDTDVDHLQETFDLIRLHGETVNDDFIKWSRTLEINVSTDAAKVLYKRLMSVPTPPGILNYIDFDVCLYDVVVDSWKHKR